MNNLAILELADRAGDRVAYLAVLQSLNLAHDWYLVAIFSMSLAITVLHHYKVKKSGR